MSVSGITFGGLASGIDTDSIISRLQSLASAPISRLKKQQAEIQQKQSVYSQFRSALSSFAQAAGSMNISDTFNPVTSSSSDMSVAVFTGSSAAKAGTYSLQVNKLAQAQKIATISQSSTSAALGLTAGTIVVNGKSVLVDETDTLTTLAQKINTVSAGVTASLIDGGSGNSYLTLTSALTGSAQRIQIADLEGTNAATLGLTDSSASVREAVTDGALSSKFSSNTDTVGKMLNTTSTGTKNFSINGVTVGVDLSTDTVQTVADKINAASTGASATVVTSTNNGTTTYQLQITGASGTPTFGDTDNVLHAMGVLQNGYGNQLVQAQNAQYKLDGVSLESSTNTITSVIPGATLTLLKADTATTNATSTLSLSKDTNAIKSKIKGFSDAYNNLVGFISNYSQLDKTTFQTGPLFGDPTARQVQASMSTMLFTDVQGVTGDYRNLASIGFKFQEDGTLTADDATLNKVLASNPETVAALFQSTGVATGANLSYVSSTSATKASGTGTYDVTITQLATKGTATANVAQTAPSVGEKLTFGGGLFGSTSYVLNIDAGATLSQTIDKINQDSKLKDLVFATQDSDGKLQLSSKKFGTSGNFTIFSNIAAANNNSGVGYGGAVYANGVDIAGTINGQEATGTGQFLTAKSDTGKASGMQIQYTGTTLGSVGNIMFRKGVATQANEMVGAFTDGVNGLLSASDKTLQTQYDDVSKSIDRLNTRLTEQQNELKTKFAAMEQAIAAIQQQGSSLSALYNNNNSN